MPRIQPAVGEVCNWCYHHIPNPLFRVDVPILQLLEHPLLILVDTQPPVGVLLTQGQPAADDRLIEDYRDLSPCSYWEHLCRTDQL